MFKHCVIDHKGYIVNKNSSQPAGEHFNQPDWTRNSEERGPGVVCFELVTLNKSIDMFSLHSQIDMLRQAWYMVKYMA